MRLPVAVLSLPLLLGGVASAQTPSPSPSPAPAPAVNPAQNLAAANAFLAANAKAPGVRVLPVGLQYKVVATGTGASPALGDAVKVDYEGKLLDGTVFDSTFQRGKPAVLMLARLVPAWLVALPLMHVGDEWTLYVPPSLGYGESGRGPIPPNSVMVFRIKLLGALTAK